MLEIFHDCFIFRDWFHYTRKKMFNVHLIILHATNCRTLKESRKVCCRVLGFHRLIPSQHSTHTHHDARRSLHDFYIWVSRGPFLREFFFPGSIFPGIFFPEDYCSQEFLSWGLFFRGRFFRRPIFWNLGKMVPRKNGPRKMVPGKLLPGKMIPGKLVPGKLRNEKSWGGRRASWCVRGMFGCDQSMKTLNSTTNLPGLL